MSEKLVFMNAASNELNQSKKRKKNVTIFEVVEKLDKRAENEHKLNVYLTRSAM